MRDEGSRGKQEITVRLKEEAKRTDYIYSSHSPQLKKRSTVYSES